jgi:putative methionine-R-sulfoxide reductase with GAF domain
MVDDELMQMSETEELDRRAMYVSLGTAAFMAVVWIIVFVSADAPGVSAIRDISLGAAMAVSLVSAGLAWRGRSRYGIWLIILTIYISVLWATWGITAGLGPALGMIALLISSGIITYTLPRKYINLTIAAAIVGTLLTIIGDIYSPIERPASGNTGSITTITFITLIVYGIFILRQFQYYTLRTKMIMLFVSISVLSVATVGNVVTVLVRGTLTEQVSSSHIQRGEKLSDFIGSIFIQKVGQIQALAIVDTIEEELERRNATYSGDEESIIANIRQLDSHWVNAGDDDPFVIGITSRAEHVNATTNQLYDFLDAFPEHPEIFVTDKYGGVVGTTYRVADYYQADEAWWQATWNDGKGAIYLSDPRYEESVDALAIQIAVPVFAEGNEEIAGIMRSTLILDDLFEAVEDVKVGETGHGVLLGRNGDVLFEDVEEDEEGTQAIDLEIRQSFIGSVPRSETITDEHGDLSVFAFAPINVEGFGEYEGEEAFGGEGEDVELEGFEAAVAEAVARLGWTIILRQEADEAFAATAQVSNGITLASLVVVIIVGILAVFFANSLTRPIRALGTAVAAVAEGNLDAPLPVAGGDEIGQLTAEFANMTRQLQHSVGELQRRTLVIETSSEVSRHLSTILNEQELVTAVVNQVQRSFNYYHAHIYLMNEQGNRLQMMGGTGHAGQEMLNSKHSIRVGVGLVGRAAASKLPVLVPDVKYDPNWLPNPLLPETLSEVAIPIMRSDQVLGVLDVQHNIINGLRQQDVELLNLIANQVAVALQNARSYTQAQRQANQQALINEIGQRLQTATTVERTLQIAAEEMGQALGTQRTTIQLNSDKRTNGR